MSATPRDAVHSAGKKRKHEDHIKASTSPSKRVKADGKTKASQNGDSIQHLNHARDRQSSKSNRNSGKSTNWIDYRTTQPIKNEDQDLTTNGVQVDNDASGGAAVRRQKNSEKNSEKDTEERASKKRKKNRRRERKREEQQRVHASASVVVATDNQSIKLERRSSPVTVHAAEKKKQRRKKRASENARAIIPSSNGTSLPVMQQGQEVVLADSRDTSSSRWTISLPSSGRFLNHDPIFVPGESGAGFLVSANPEELQVLALETSLVDRTHSAPPGVSITCYAIDAANDALIHVGYSDGTMSSWNMSTDFEPKERLTAEGTLLALALAPPMQDGKVALFYLSKMATQYGIFIQDLLLYSTKHQLQDIQVIGDGEYIVSRGPSTLVLGMNKDKNNSRNDFIWIEIPLNSTSTCFNARVVSPPQNSNKKTSKRQPQLSLVLGNSNGQIHLYEDLSSLFSQTSPDHHHHTALPTPRVLHWHREAVSSVKFSRDGNYLISGGRETVLVIWQLETGKKQFLPHLTSEILRIVVNPAGDRYAVQMGDNSIMVLSTSELKPVALFAGLQMMPLKEISTSRADNDATTRGLVAALHPHQPTQLLLAVPSSQPEPQNDNNSRAFLQTFDISHSRHISRQALTRNNVTDFNLGPERTPIIPPDVTHISISPDGDWLATLDEWMPPASDLGHLSSDHDGIERERQRRREVHLKIWLWHEKEGMWTLSTRVDSPHARGSVDGMGAGRVLALAADPSSAGFVTVGEDRRVRVWKPRRRRQDAEFVEWTCKRTIQLPSELDPEMDGLDSLMDVGRQEACVAYSQDGSLLAVSFRRSSGVGIIEETPIVYFVDPTLATDPSPKAGLAKQDIHALGFIERYLVVVSHQSVYVWDLVEETLMYKVPLAEPNNPHLDGFTCARPPMLAIDYEEGTFAVVTEGRKVEVYSPRNSNTLYEPRFETTVEGILSGHGRRGFVVAFEDATLQTISPGVASSRLRSLPSDSREQLDLQGPTPHATLVEAELPEETDDEIVGLTSTSVKLLKQSEAPAMLHAPTEEDDRPVVRPEQLASILDVGASFVMPPVKDMFQAVVGLFGRKPLHAFSVA